MAFEIRVTLKNDDKIRRALRDPKLVEGPIRDFLASAGATVEGRAKFNSPVDTGRLRASFAHRVEAKLGRVRIGSNVRYASPLEFSRKRPRGIGRIPFLRPALSESVGDINRQLRRLGQAIGREFTRRTRF